MNRVIVTNEEAMIRGNTVLAPRQVPNKHRDYEKKNKNRKKRNIKIKNKLIVMRNIILVFLIGMILVGRYCAIYNMQKQLNTINSNISELNKSNDNLKVELVKYNNLHYIEEVATTKLKMITPNRNDAIYCNISKEKIVSTSDQSNTKSSLLSKVVKSIF